jgi:hypothetical protein
MKCKEGKNVTSFTLVSDTQGSYEHFRSICLLHVPELGAHALH